MPRVDGQQWSQQAKNCYIEMNHMIDAYGILSGILSDMHFVHLYCLLCVSVTPSVVSSSLLRNWWRYAMVSMGRSFEQIGHGSVQEHTILNAECQQRGIRFQL